MSGLILNRTETMVLQLIDIAGGIVTARTRPGTFRYFADTAPIADHWILKFAEDDLLEPVEGSPSLRLTAAARELLNSFR